MDQQKRYEPNYIPGDGFRMVADQKGLARLSRRKCGGVIWRGTFDHLLKGARCLDQRGIYHWNSDRGDRALAQAIDFCMQALELKDLPYARETRRGLWHFLRPFYTRESSGFGFVFFESCRDRLLQRFASSASSPHVIQEPVLTMVPQFDRQSIVTARERTIRLRAQEGLVPRGLQLAPPPGRLLRDSVLSRTKFRRRINCADGRIFVRDYDIWCLSTPSIDEPLLRSGQYPTRVQQFVGDHVNPSRLMSWLSVDIETGMAGNYCFDVDPCSGEILTIRWTRQELEMLIHSDPRFDRWLFAATYGRDYVTNG